MFEIKFLCPLLISLTIFSLPLVLLVFCILNRSLLFQVGTPHSRKIKPQLKPLNMNLQELQNIASPKTLTPNTPATPSTPLTNGVTKYNLENVDPSAFNSPMDNFVEPKRPSSIRKPQKRIRSPNWDTDYSPGM